MSFRNIDSVMPENTSHSLTYQAFAHCIHWHMQQIVNVIRELEYAAGEFMRGVPGVKYTYV